MRGLWAPLRTRQKLRLLFSERRRQLAHTIWPCAQSFCKRPKAAWEPGERTPAVTSVNWLPRPCRNLYFERRGQRHRVELAQSQTAGRIGTWIEVRLVWSPPVLSAKHPEDLFSCPEALPPQKMEKNPRPGDRPGLAQEGRRCRSSGPTSSTAWGDGQHWGNDRSLVCVAGVGPSLGPWRGCCSLCAYCLFAPLLSEEGSGPGLCWTFLSPEISSLSLCSCPPHKKNDWEQERAWHRFQKSL